MHTMSENTELWSEYDRDDVFYYLDLLRQSAVTNMFGAGSYLREEYGMDSDESSAALTEWMRTFGERHPA
jgi:hypothetical protein